MNSSNTRLPAFPSPVRLYSRSPRPADLRSALPTPDSPQAATLAARPWGDETANAGEINAWIVIEPDDTIIIRYGRAEMGQGSFTALPMIVAEELECDWAKVKAEYASANRNFREKEVYGRLGTGGSRAVRETRPMLQQAGASARERLIAAAAKRWGVPASECTAEMSKVMHKASGRTLRYGELVRDATQIKLDKEPAIKTPDQFKLMGKPMARLDTPLKINGSAVYGIDIKVPDMVHAAIMACPVFGGRLKSVDESAIAGRRGVMQVVKLPQCGRGGRGPLLARQGGARTTCRSNGIRAPAPAATAHNSERPILRLSTSAGASHATTATSMRPCRAPPRSLRRCMRRRSSATRRWSRSIARPMSRPTASMSGSEPRTPTLPCSLRPRPPA